MFLEAYSENRTDKNMGFLCINGSCTKSRLKIGVYVQSRLYAREVLNG